MASRKVLTGCLVWFLAAFGIGASGLLARVPMPFPQVLIFGLTGGLLLLFWKSSVFREWAFTVTLPALVRIHVTRFVGFYFLYLYSRGELPYAFAVPGGWGDITVATTAIMTSFFSPEGPVGRKIYFAWNVLGFADILFVVSTAGRLGLANPGSMSALTHLPLSFLATFLVPIIIFTHLLMFVRLRKPRTP